GKDPEPDHADEQEQSPETDPHSVDRAERPNEGSEHEELDHERFGVERRQPPERALRCATRGGEQDERRRAGRHPRSHEQRPQPRAVRPDGSVRDRQEDSRIAGDEEPEQAADAPDELGDSTLHHAADGAERRHLEPPRFGPRPEGREHGQQSEQEQRPCAERAAGPPIPSMRRLRRPTSANTPSTAALANENEALLARLRDGSVGFRGSPYTSGSSTRR